MRLDFLFSLKPSEFIGQLEYHRRSDYLSPEVAKELDREASELLINAKRKVELLTLYLLEQLPRYVGDKIDITSEFKLDSDSTMRIRFKEGMDLDCLEHYMKGYPLDADKADNSIKIKIHDDMTFLKICDFLKKLQMEINTNGVSIPLLVDQGMYSHKSAIAPNPTASHDNKPVRAKL